MTHRSPSSRRMAWSIQPTRVALVDKLVVESSITGCRKAYCSRAAWDPLEAMLSSESSDMLSSDTDEATSDMLASDEVFEGTLKNRLDIRMDVRDTPCDDVDSSDPGTTRRPESRGSAALGMYTLVENCPGRFRGWFFPSGACHSGASQSSRLCSFSSMRPELQGASPPDTRNDMRNCERSACDEVTTRSPRRQDPPEKVHSGRSAESFDSL
mmetsp:Transcript_14249/g.29145  ORF Transcript_14249/g.29145 Transcript_14249/m.29145 type:complete len:212 (+) Transcript_14249:254-889(+)